MSRGSLKASKEGIDKAKKALTRNGLTQKALAEDLAIARSTVSKFFNSHVVDRSFFQEICSKLGLDWNEIFERPPEKPELENKNQDKGSDIDELVREVRSRACEKIKTVHGTMRMLRVNRPVPVDDIYIELNVLEQVSCDRTFSDWRRDFQPNWRSFDRLGLGQASEEGVPALDIVREYPKLMVFGKPGSGKTTFLKSLATRCIDIERQLQWHQKDYVPIFITLKKFAQDARKQGDFSLFNYIHQREFCSWGEKNQQVVEAILDQGRALVLLDGLDEVQGQEYESVIEEVESFCEYFHRNRFLITCRTQSQRYKFEGFTDVEVADFKPGQVNRFINRWFAVVVGNAESENLAASLNGQLQQPQNQQIAELAVTPVLLNLICFVFCGGKGNLPKNRADLYKKGLRDLLERLDESKGVQREPAYEELMPEAKEKLLTYLAVTLFKANDYFPEQETLEKLIIEHLDISPSKATKVLKSIEEQSGLIVERSEGFWSFSHLTFQEYFTAKWFCDRTDWAGLLDHIKESHWREVFLLTVGMLHNADELLRLMKQKADELVANDETLQQFLKWVSHSAISVSVKTSFKPVFARALCLNPEREGFIPPDARNLDLSLTFNFDRIRNVEGLLNLAYNFDRICYLTHAFVCTPSCDGHFLATERPLHFCFDIMNVRLHVSEHMRGYMRSIVGERRRREDELLTSLKCELTTSELSQAIRKLTDDLTHNLISKFKYTHGLELNQALQNLKNQLLDSLSDTYNWWQERGLSWINELKMAMIEYCNIGRDWLLSSQQKELLNQYYDANRLLVDCLNSGCEVSEKVRKEIEESLLLPIDEIQKYQQQMQVAAVADK